MVCEHNWIFMNTGFMDEKNEAEQYEIFYCSKCLMECTIEYPEGIRTITSYKVALEGEISEESE